MKITVELDKELTKRFREKRPKWSRLSNPTFARTLMKIGLLAYETNFLSEASVCIDKDGNFVLHT